MHAIDAAPYVVTATGVGSALYACSIRCATFERKRGSQPGRRVRRCNGAGARSAGATALAAGLRLPATSTGDGRIACSASPNVPGTTCRRRRRERVCQLPVGTRTLPPSHGIDASPGVVMRGASAPGSARWECAVRHLHAEIRTRGSGRRPADLIASPPREAPRIRWRGHPQELVRQKTSAASGPVPRIGSGFPR